MLNTGSKDLIHYFLLYIMKLLRMLLSVVALFLHRNQKKNVFFCLAVNMLEAADLKVVLEQAKDSERCGFIR